MAITSGDGSGGSNGASGSSGAADDSGARPEAAANARPRPTLSLVDSIVQLARDGAGAIVKPEVAATVGFPLLLLLTVLLFLLVQSRMDDRDPKLRSAPLTADDTLVSFDEEGR